MFNQINKLGTATVTGLTLGIILLSSLLSEPVYARCYKQRLPFGGWTEICPPSIPSGGSGESSCLSVYVAPKEYRIVNKTTTKINYTLNDKSYTLEPSYRYDHSIGGGSNSCNITNTPVEIKFYSSFTNRSEVRILTEGTSSNRQYSFKREPSGSIDLVYESR